jgi:hypothetical protein
MKRRLLVSILWFLLLFGGSNRAGLGQTVSAPPQKVVSRFKLKPFYQKYLNVEGLPVLSSAKVSDYALLEAQWLIRQMLKGRNDIVREMVKNNVRVAIMAYSERTTMIPEHSDLTPSRYWDRRARGLGATPERPAVSGGEENLLSFPGDPYRGESIFIHEFAHAIHEMGMRTLDPEFEPALESAFQNAKAKRLWQGTYALTNKSEYWAEGVQSFFDCNAAPNSVHNEVNTREKLAEYDPALYTLIASVFKNRSFRYVEIKRRQKQAHLKDYKPAEAPRFQWEPELEHWYKEYIRTHQE